MANIGVLALDHHDDRREKSLLRQAITAKGPANLLVPNVYHLLLLAHVTNGASLP